MDSLSQIVLGAGVAELCMGRKLGNKAMLIGAIAGTVPDLDVLTNLFTSNEVLKLQIHRSYSHSIIVHILLAFPFAYLCYRIFKKKYNWWSFYFLWYLCLSTHSILDSFTTYGTQLLLPFTNKLIGFNNISVVDPWYTLPFMTMLIIAMFYNKASATRRKWAIGGVLVSSLYMCFTFANKYYVYNIFKDELKSQKIKYEGIHTSPTLGQNALWCSIVTTDSVLYMGEYSILQKNKNIEFVKYHINKHLLTKYKSEALDVLLWFSQEKYILEENRDTLNFYVVKWGRMDYTKAEPSEVFKFYFKLYRGSDGEFTFMPQQDFKGASISDIVSTMNTRIFK